MHHIKKFNKNFNFQDLVSKTLSKENLSRHFYEDGHVLIDKFNKKLGYKLLMQTS